MISTNHHRHQVAFDQPIMTNPHCKQGAFDPETGSVRYICRLHCGASLASAKVDFVMMMVMVDFVMMMIMVVVVHSVISIVTLCMTCKVTKKNINAYSCCYQFA